MSGPRGWTIAEGTVDRTGCSICCRRMNSALRILRRSVTSMMWDVVLIVDMTADEKSSAVERDCLDPGISPQSRRLRKEACRPARPRLTLAALAWSECLARAAPERSKREPASRT
jgi:hypothetical protein